MTQIEQALREAAKIRGGFRLSDVKCPGGEKIRTRAQAFVRTGFLHRVAVSYKVVRYFGSVKDAIAYEATVRAVPVSVATKAVKAGWGKETQPYYPTNADGTPAYKVTIALVVWRWVA